MLLKWGIGGAIVGCLFAIFTSVEMFQGVIVGFLIGIAIRKWIFRNLWM